MTSNYIRLKIKEALDATNGDKNDAQKLLLTWAVRDQPLLLGLTKPHLKEIAISWIEQTMKTQKKSSGSSGAHFSKNEINDIISSRPAGEKRTTKIPPPKTSMRQASVMRQLVAAFKKK